MAVKPHSPFESAPPDTPLAPRPSPLAPGAADASGDVAASLASLAPESPAESPESPFSPAIRSPPVPPLVMSSNKEGSSGLQTGGSLPPLPSPRTHLAGGQGLGRSAAFHRQVTGDVGDTEAHARAPVATLPPLAP